MALICCGFRHLRKVLLAALLYSKWLISCRFDVSSKSIDVTKLTYRFERNVHGGL